MCVFCGSSAGNIPEYIEKAVELGHLLAEQNITLVYGGGHVGLMGIIADAVLDRGGKVIGVIPEALERLELAHQGLTELHVVESMHQRKALMAEFADAFIAMPGGIGTFEEFFEVLTWTQLGIHNKPSGLLNVAGYYDPAVAQLDLAVANGFLKQEHRDLVLSDDDPATLLRKIEEWRFSYTGKWIGPKNPNLKS